MGDTGGAARGGATLRRQSRTYHRDCLGGHNLRIKIALRPRLCRILVRRHGHGVLRVARHAVALGHVLAGDAHGQKAVFGHVVLKHPGRDLKWGGEGVQWHGGGQHEGKDIIFL